MENVYRTQGEAGSVGRSVLERTGNIATPAKRKFIPKDEC